MSSAVRKSLIGFGAVIVAAGLVAGGLFGWRALSGGGLLDDLAEFKGASGSCHRAESMSSGGGWDSLEFAISDELNRIDFTEEGEDGGSSTYAWTFDDVDDGVVVGHLEPNAEDWYLDELTDDEIEELTRFEAKVEIRDDLLMGTFTVPEGQTGEASSLDSGPLELRDINLVLELSGGLGGPDEHRAYTGYDNGSGRGTFICEVNA